MSEKYIDYKNKSVNVKFTLLDLQSKGTIQDFTHTKITKSLLLTIKLDDKISGIDTYNVIIPQSRIMDFYNGKEKGNLFNTIKITLLN